MKPSLWDLKLYNTLGQPIGSAIMKPSLWDLKHWSVNLYKKLQYHHEAIPMGFETSVLTTLCIAPNPIMKPSLWDLKQVI